MKLWSKVLKKLTSVVEFLKRSLATWMYTFRMIFSSFVLLLYNSLWGKTYKTFCNSLIRSGSGFGNKPFWDKKHRASRCDKASAEYCQSSSTFRRSFFLIWNSQLFLTFKWLFKLRERFFNISRRLLRKFRANFQKALNVLWCRCYSYFNACFESKSYQHITLISASSVKQIENCEVFRLQLFFGSQQSRINLKESPLSCCYTHIYGIDSTESKEL